MTYPYHGFLRFAPDVLWTIDEDGEGNVKVSRNDTDVEGIINATEMLQKLIDRTITNFTIPKGVETVGYSICLYCTDLTVLNIPEGVKTIDTNALRYCSSLEDLDLPSTLLTIAASSLANMTALKTIILRATNPPTLHSSALTGTTPTVIYVPDASVDTYKTATNWSTYASIIQPISDMPE